MTALVPVRFLEPWGSLNAGDIAGFEPSTAQALVASGTARYHGLPAQPDFGAENLDLPDAPVTDVTQVTASLLVVPADPSEPARLLTGWQVGAVDGSAGAQPASDQPATIGEPSANSGELPPTSSDQPATIGEPSANSDGQDGPSP